MNRIAGPSSRCAHVVLAAMLSLPLSGCVAAAIPLAAGGLLAKRHMSSTRAPAQATSAMQASATSDLTVTRLTLTELPPPDAVGSGRNPAVTALLTYATDEAAKPAGAGKRTSALLTRASDLRNDRATCKAVPPAIFVDLDPGRGTFDPLAPGQPDRELAASLAELRGQGVTVVWFSRLGAAFESATRDALAASGFDTAGTDRLILLKDLDERKQSRRDDEAKRVCPIAMLGDERADFDELYLYLKQPEAALALDAMIGRGWFLASPFIPAEPKAKETTR